MHQSDWHTVDVYSPLSPERKEIRVLVLEHAAKANEPLCFRMLTTSLLDEVVKPYCAVSYTWGTNTDRTIIRINGVDVDVPASGAAALRGILRVLGSTNEGLHKPLWIDAICINQNEKAWHVAMMQDVYSQADTVLIWLGAIDEGAAESTVRSLRLLSEDSLQWIDDNEEWDKILDLGVPPKVSLPYWNCNPPEADWDAMISLLHNRWFSRLWVVQELALARRVLCILGRQTFEWEVLARAFMWAAHRDFIFDTSRFGDEPAPFDIFECDSRLDLLHIFSFTRRFLHMDEVGADQSYFVRLAVQLETTKPHDRVYGLLGILSHPDWGEFGRLARQHAPDYDRPLVEVYADMMWASIHTKDDLQALESSLYLLPPPRIYVQNWPTWVPRYYLGRVGQSFYTAPQYTPSDEQDISAAADEKSVAELCRRPGNAPILRLQGVGVAKVERVFPSPLTAIPLFQDLRPGQQEDELLKHFTYLWDPDFLHNASGGWTKEVFKTIAATLVACNTDTENLEVDFADFVLQVQHECKGPVAEDLNQMLFEYNYSNEFEHAYLTRLRCAYAVWPSSTTFAQLSGGRFAICPNAVAEGDEVAIMMGADYPWLLRKSEQCWKILGLCALPEIMDGEYIRKLKHEGRFEDEKRMYDIN